MATYGSVHTMNKIGSIEDLLSKARNTFPNKEEEMVAMTFSEENGSAWSDVG